MKRRSAPMAGVVKTRPIEVLPRSFFLLIIHETPRMSIVPPNNNSRAVVSSTKETLVPPVFPQTPGIKFVELEEAFVNPSEHERRLDAAHTIRFCRFMNAMRRKHTHAPVIAAANGDLPSQVRLSTLPFGRPQQIHFFVRSFVRGDEGGLVQLLIRWRLLCLHLSPDDALAPFQHLQWLFRSDFVSVRDSLAGIGKGVAMEILFPRQELDGSDDSNASLHGGSVDDSGIIRITKRYVVFASPVDRTVATDTPRTIDVDLERPPTGAIVTDTSPPPLVIPPSSLPTSSPVVRRLCVAQLVPLLKEQRVAMVVKLNALPRYDDQLIIRGGIDHLDLSTRSDSEGIDRSVVGRFLESCENASPHGVVAVHSSSGLGRAAFCVGCYLVKHLQFSSAEAIGWIRFCCPGAFPSWYETLLHSMEATLTREGHEHRRQEEQAGSLSSRRSLDDLALASSLSPARLASEISIGKMSLGRDSLLGTKDKSARDRETGAGSLGPVNPAQIVPVARSSGSYKELQAAQQLIASDATLVRRRPLTQGAAGRRRLLDHHHTHRVSDTGTANGSGTRDFATIHKFLHQSTGSTASSSRSSASSAYSTSNTSALRPPATAPDRSTTMTSLMRSNSKTELTFD